MSQLVNILYQITVALKGPVVIGLLILLAWTLYQVGVFGREWFSRRRAADAWRNYLESIAGGGQSPDALIDRLARLGRYPTLAALFAEQSATLARDRVHLDKLIDDIEIEANRFCYRMHIGVRIGPILGLMGTLIPMGPALMGISTGDMESMAVNLIVAFSTTVVGLLIGALCYVMFLTRRHWYARDLNDVEYVFENVFAAGEEA